MRFVALIDGGPGANGLVFPNLPGCAAVGITVEAILASASAPMGCWMETVESKGGVVPPPRYHLSVSVRDH